MAESRDDPVESGALEEEGDGEEVEVETPPLRDDPVEAGALEDEPASGEP